MSWIEMSLTDSGVKKTGGVGGVSVLSPWLLLRLLLVYCS